MSVRALRMASKLAAVSRRPCLFTEIASLPLHEAVDGLDMPGFCPGIGIYAALLRRCAEERCLAAGIRVHEHAAKKKMDTKLFLGNTIVDMYGSCGELHSAGLVFDKMEERNVYSWTIMMSASAQNGHPEKALQLFYKMIQDGACPNNHTVSLAISSCSALMDLCRGRKIYAGLESSGFRADDHVKNSLMVLYAKCGRLDDVKAVFWSIGNAAKAASWSCLIVGCVQLGSYIEAFYFFRLMELQGIRADAVTYAGLLDACSGLASLSLGRNFHSRVSALGLLETDVVLQTSVLTMYSKCGKLAEAREIFDGIAEKNIVVWSAMIIAYARGGDCSMALKLFRRMEQEGQRATQTAFVSVLYACSHAGLVDDAYYYLTSMTGERGMAALLEHYGCIVDLFGRAGRLGDAEELIQRVAAPDEDEAKVLWSTLLGACKTHGGLEVAGRAAGRVLAVDPASATPYVLLSNVYSDAGSGEK